jgi:hypothetical protein
MPVAYAVARERLVMQPYFSRAKEAFRMKLQRIGLVLLVVLLLGSVGAASAAEKVIFTDGLEKIDPVTKLPQGWTIFSQNNGDAGSPSADIVRSGKYSWFMDDPDNTVSLGIRSPRIPAEAGKLYRASAYVYTMAVTTNVYIEFWDAAGKRIVAEAVKQSVRNDWEELSITKEAPAGTASVSVILYSQQLNKGVQYFDDVTIVQLD